MEKTKKIWWLILIIIFICGCITPAPPLKDSEVPFKIQNGIVFDSENIPHKITDDNPRWSVSEAYLYESVTEPNKTFVQILQENKPMLGTILIILVFIIYTRGSKT